MQLPGYSRKEDSRDGGSYGFFGLSLRLRESLALSAAIIKTKALVAWLGWLGIGVATVAMVILLAGVVVTDLHGPRIFIGGYVF